MTTTTSRLDQGEVLALIGPLVLVIDRVGTIRGAYGAAEGVAGYRTDDLIDHRVVELVAESDRADLIGMFRPHGDHPVLNSPSPFPVWIVGRHGERELVHVIPRSFDRDGGGWVLTIVPRNDAPTSARVADLMIDGASLETVLRELVTHQAATTRELRVDPHIVVRPGRRDHAIISAQRNRCSDTLQTLMDADNDRLWRDIPPNGTHDYTVQELPAILRLVAEFEGFTSCSVTRIDVDGRLECILVTLVADPIDAMRQGNVAINERERIRVVTHAVRRDVADRALRAAALEDSLTGLSNRGRFDQLLDASDGGDTTLLFIDLDHFKDVNDRFGHRVGDQVLIEVADRLRSVCRPSDVISRIGGDEFAVLLPDTDETTAMAISDRLLRAISAPLPDHLGPRSISASVGVARRVGHGDPLELLHIADRAMLSGKRAGRGRVVVGN